MFDRASSFSALVGIAVDVVSLFMALLSFRGISTPSLSAQGEQRRFSYFNIDRDDSSNFYKLEFNENSWMPFFEGKVGPRVMIKP